MGAVVDVITALEKTAITKEVLEITRLGKYINELRRKTSNDALAKRAKDLVRRWRDMVLPSAHTTPQPTPADPAPPALNGAKPHSPALRSLKPQSPALRGLKPQSPLSRDATPLRVLSPALSLHSERSRSPNSQQTPCKPVTAGSNHRLSPGDSPKVASARDNHLADAVPRTHSSNKRLRKENTENVLTAASLMLGQGEPMAKRQRLNGENVSVTGMSSSITSQVPSNPALKERISEQSVDNTLDEGDGISGPKKRGRKKGSKSMKKQPHVEDRVKEKLASISRNPKLKTTQELLADLQARGSTNNASSLGIEGGTSPSQSSKEPPSMEDVLRGSSEHQVSKYLRATQRATESSRRDSRRKANDNGHDTPTPSSRYRRENEGPEDNTEERKGKEKSPSRTRQDLTVEEILAKLPPLDPNSIDWTDWEEEEVREEEDHPPREVTTEDLERLHTKCIEGLNGNFQPKLSSLTSTISNNITSTTNSDTTSDATNSDISSKPGSSSADVLLQDSSNHLDAGYRSNDGRSDVEFREWHEMLARPSYNGQILHILPYVIID
ncbi:mediator of RNA polymerase II transcription subunit 26 isoform X2 [Cephus cinctus]|nr:mediator of RNA polymerase II transcription subunit 26 isoform X2 [Cephus cinctus]XP_015602768.1 mediator of RNA polymerase II transcription subunit 26 isoform X2 [Cephus cinctus]XP_015602769.1 mediator of RNA polymerase II transcription subunit 26 isoform X2 [Cephus cinctus]